METYYTSEYRLKIAAKALASRINKVLRTVTDSDQNGFICTWGAALSTRLIEDILRYTETNDIEGAMIWLDFRKAFNTIKRDFILYAFESFNFGESMKKWTTTLFCNTVTCISHNGFMSNFFIQEEGLRQGCNLSPLLFIASKIRHSNEIRGTELPSIDHDKKEAKIT